MDERRRDYRRTQAKVRPLSQRKAKIRKHLTLARGKDRIVYFPDPPTVQGSSVPGVEIKRRTIWTNIVRKARSSTAR